MSLVLDALLDRTVVGGYPKWGLLLRRRLPGWPADPAPDALAGRTAIVTGASSGLGRATAAGLLRLGADVHLVVRSVERGEQANADLGGGCTVWRCDVADLDDVRRFAGEFAGTAPRRLDVLVHNAGTLPQERSTSPQGHELTLATHVLGPLLMTELLLPSLRAAMTSRVVLVTSGGMYAQRLPLEDPEYRRGEYRGATAYARTKRIQVALAPLLTQRWVSAGVAVHATHPGWADTPGLARSLPGFHRVTRALLRDDVQGADTTVWLAATEPAPPGGRLWHDRRARPSHLVPWTRDTEGRALAMLGWCVHAAGLSSIEETS